MRACLCVIALAFMLPACNFQVKRDLKAGFDCVISADPGWMGSNMFRVKANAISDDLYTGISRRRQVAEQRAWECTMKGATILASGGEKTLKFAYNNPPKLDKPLSEKNQSALRETAHVFEKTFTDTDSCTLNVGIRLPKSAFLSGQSQSGREASAEMKNLTPSDTLTRPVSPANANPNGKIESTNPKEKKDSDEPVLDF
jgi:hypothetical protein